MMTGREGKNITRAVNLYKVGSSNLMFICTKKERTMEMHFCCIPSGCNLICIIFLIQILCHKQGVGSL